MPIRAIQERGASETGRAGGHEIACEGLAACGLRMVLRTRRPHRVAECPNVLGTLYRR